MAALPLITAGVGAATAALNKSSANTQQATQNQLLQAPQAANQAYQAAQTQLAQRQFGSNQAQLALKQALQGGLLQGLKDTSITPPSSIAAKMGKTTGGLRPSAITGGAQIGSDLQRQALLDLMGGGSGNSAVPRAGTPGAGGAPASTDPSSGPMSALWQGGDMIDMPAAGLPAGTPQLPQSGGLSKFLNFALPVVSGGVGIYDAWKKAHPDSVPFTLR